MEQIRIGLIGGSGLGAALTGQLQGNRHDIDTPFGKPSNSILETAWAGIPIFVLSRHGAGHAFNPSQIPFRANIFALKQLGCTHIIASGAVGSLRDEFRPRELVIPDQIIDKTHKRANTFFDHAAVHTEFAEPFCPILRQILKQAAQGSTVHSRGCYVAMEGPAFSTRAESLMHRLWGGDLIGMTCMPEAKLAREAEIAYALVALVTDYDCWKAPSAKEGQVQPAMDPSVLLKEIIGNLNAAADAAIALMKRAVELIATLPADQLQSPAHQALKLAIWTEKGRITSEERQRLAPLWIKYFE